MIDIKKEPTTPLTPIKVPEEPKNVVSPKKIKMVSPKIKVTVIPIVMIAWIWTCQCLRS